MQQLPNYIAPLFMAAVFFSAWLFYRSSGGNKKVLWIMIVWFLVQSTLGLSGFFTVTTSIPPRLSLLVLPPVVLILLLLILPAGKAFADKTDLKVLTLLHLVRIPVELVLYSLVFYKLMPELMTFGGRNYDIISGLSAPVIYYLGFVKRTLTPGLLLAWNIVCLGILLFTVITGILSAPGPLQQFAFDQPNIAVLYFPFVLLPGTVVPLVFLAHGITIRRQLNELRMQQKTLLTDSIL